MPNTENVVTFRCGDDLLEEIDAAADSSRFDTRAAFLRWHLEETIGEPYTDGAESDRSALAERIDELEEQLTDVVGRLEQLEGESDEPETSVVELNQFDSKQGDSHELEYAGESIREREPLFESARDEASMDRPNRHGGQRRPALPINTRRRTAMSRSTAARTSGFGSSGRRCVGRLHRRRAVSMQAT